MGVVATAPPLKHMAIECRKELFIDEATTTVQMDADTAVEAKPRSPGESCNPSGVNLQTWPWRTHAMGRSIAHPGLPPGYP